MAVTKEKKQKIISDLKDKVARQKAIILVAISGLKVKDLSELKKRLKAVQAELKVAKKTLANLVFKEYKIDFHEEDFKEETAFIFGFKDEISPAKAAYQFGLSNDKLKILGGFIKNKLNSKEEMIALAQLPTRDELLTRLVGSIKAPVSNFVYALKYNLKGLTYLLTKIKT